MTTGYSSGDVCRLAGVTYRQLGYWCRTGFIPGVERRSPGTGRKRFFSSTQVMLIAYAAALSEAGFTVAAAFEIATRLAYDGEAVVSLAGGLVTVGNTRAAVS
jgi:DNA-binding transcriptional MerR regulator